MRLLIMIITASFLFACDENTDPPQPTLKANFSWEDDYNNYLGVQFQNHSKNAERYHWNFGDGNTSTLENPNHVYDQSGDYDVTLQAYASDGSSDSITKNLTLVSVPTPPLWSLTADESKTWKLYRVGSPVSFGPDSSQPDLYWSGFLNDGSRSCLFKHEFTFHRDMTFTFEDHNGFYGDWQIWPQEYEEYENCFQPNASNMVVNGVDLSLWRSSTHTFQVNFEDQSITLFGKGAWMGFPYLGTTENHGTNMPDSVTFSYTIVSLENHDVLTINFDHGNEGYWTFNYASYRDIENEPQLVE